MREENAIFRDLSAICASSGYVHALAYLCFRDNVVKYSDEMCAKDLEHLFSMDRLIRTETSTLIGLMVQQEIDWSLPNAQTIQYYIDETERLLKELHEVMLVPAMTDLRDTLETGKETNPFEKGSNLREPIFYGGESAYSFQFRNLSVPKYQADDLWLEREKGFTIQGARDVVHALGKLQSSRFTSIIDSLADRHPEDWTFLPWFLFTIEELVEAANIDHGLIQRVVNALVLPSEESNATFRAIDDFNVVSAMPILPVGDGRFLLIEVYTLMQSLYESPFYLMCEDRGYRDIAMRNRGRFVESFASSHLESVFGKRAVFPNVRIPEAKGKDASEIEALVLFADRAIVVQAKSKRLTLEARKGNDNLIRDDFKKSVQDSYDQALECAELLASANRTLIGPDGATIKVPEKLKEIYIVCVLSDHYPALSFQARQFLVRAPLLSFKSKHGDDFKIKCAAFCHPTLFYLPADVNGCTVEGVVRFEYIQPIAKRALHNYHSGMPLRPIALSDEAFAVFIDHLGRFLFRRDCDAEVYQNIDSYRDLVLDELAKTSSS